MISAHGPKATAYAQRLGDIEAIVSDPSVIGAAYLEAVRRRESAAPVYGLVLLDDPRVAFGLQYGDQILAQLPDYDLRVQWCQELALGRLPINKEPAEKQWQQNWVNEQGFVEFLWLCDTLLVRSFAEYERILAMFHRNPVDRPVHAVERILAEGRVPQVARVRPERPGIVVWCPDRPAAEFALALTGLAEVHATITCASAGGAPPRWSYGATFVNARDPQLARALATASAVVCLDPSDPSDAVAFARQGYGVVAPLTSGAHEFAGDIVQWDALDAPFLYAAVAAAIARPACVTAEPARPARVPAGLVPRPDFIADQLPLVTIITPTYNRPDELRRMLSSVAAQTYPNIESVVVNDGGVAVDDVVAEFPFARLIDQRPNAGTARAQFTGWQNARGEYIGLLPDDDWLYPDHVERLVTAMLRSGARLAHGGGLLRYLEREDGGDWTVVGFNASVFCQTVCEADALVTSPVSGHQMLVHRSLYEDVGWYELDSDISDNEIHARFTKNSFYVFVDHVTCEFRDHSGSQGRLCDFPTAMRHMYTELHPVQNRPYVEKYRAIAIENVQRREPGKSPFARTLLIHR